MPKGETSRPANRSQRKLLKMTGSGAARQAAETARVNRANLDKDDAKKLKRELKSKELAEVMAKEKLRRDINSAGNIRSAANTAKTLRKMTRQRAQRKK